MQQMHVCDQWKRYIPAEMEYGKLLHPSIPRGSTLIFEVELLGVDWCLYLVECLLDVVEDILDILDAYGEADEVGGNSGFFQLLVR